MSRTRHLRAAGMSFAYSPRAVLVSAMLLVATLAVAILSLGTGTISLSPDVVARAVLGLGEPSDVLIVRDLRLPRVATALLVGACLGVSGAIFQSVSRNPLGSPDFLGFTTGAATGAILQIIVFGGGAAAVALSAFAGGIGTAVLVYVLSYRGGATGGSRLVLVGVGMGAVLAAVNQLIIVRADLDAAFDAQIWASGSLNIRTWEDVVPILIGAIILIPLALTLQKRASMVEMGDAAAASLGVRPEALRLAAMAVGVALAAAATATVGPIAFVALAAAPLARALTRRSGPAFGSGALMGALLLASADLLSGLASDLIQIPVGLMTGLLGGLYLIWLLTRSRL
ncbi:iron chelate uptake ABC transporter family permease subunit [Demequina sp. NBRC 110054]|uniref:FecCD family ABC transporter permease n=1 Tax=Demequina sp. NBRC 110054 TaxID=1570343 RepID=UPI001F45FD3E|nr:iron chelate uptake ABC transporter family permease subunit [Demequina sp. NBRC 110054]